MEYKEFLFTESGKRHFTLSDDSISVTGKGFNETVLLKDLVPEYRTVRQRTGGYYLGLGAFVLGLIGAAIFAVLRNTETEFYVAVGLAVFGLLLSFATWRKVEHAIFKNKTGIDAISIARAGADSSSFDLFVDELSRGIRQAKERERIRPASSCEIPARARGAAMKRRRLFLICFSICLSIFSIVLMGGSILWPFWENFFSPIIGLKDKDPTVRQRAVEGLAESWVPKPVTLLTGALKDADGKVREAAAKALGEIGDKAAFEPLIGTLQDEDVRVRIAAALAIGDVLPAVEDPETRARAVEPLIRAMKDEDGELSHFVGPTLLGKIGLPAFEPLIAALQDEDAPLRRAAALGMQTVLPAIEDPETRARALEPLIRVMKDDSFSFDAAAALAEIGEPALEPFIADLQDKNPSVRKQAAESLGRIIRFVREPTLTQKAMQPLINALQDKDVPVRRAAARAMRHVLRAVKNPATRARAVQPLIRAMKDADYVVRPYAAAALGEIGEPAMEPFIADLQDKNPSVREQAAESLGRIIPVVREPEPTIDYRHPFVPEPTLTQKAMQPLINALQDKDVRVRRAAARAMHAVVSAVKDPETRARAVEPLIRAMKDTDHEVHVHAAVALGKIGTENAKNALRNAGFDPEP